MTLAVTRLSVTKSGKPILSGVGFTAPLGSITGLIGPNGAGKSTLLTALLGLTPATGTAHFDNRDLPAMPRRDRARLVAFVEQSASTEERLSVRDVVALGRIPFEAAWQSGPSPEDDAIIGNALADTEMTAFSARRFDTLSGGEQQRVHLARALAQQPRLLLLDEPTSHLDIRAQLQLLALLRRKADAGMTILIALHDLNLAARFCDHMVVLSEGRRVAEGAPSDILTPALLEAVYGVHARLVPDAGSARPLIVYDEATPRNSP
ncbi:ABC transporter ATP-binding protein [Devosia sp. CAU 1758]